MTNHPLVIILGATASGKTKLSIELAKALNTEIISADSRQVFKGMDIGTGKDLREFKDANIRYHLIDIKAAGQNYNVNCFKEDFYAAFTAIIEKNKLPILCGGTGMYIHSLLQNQEYTAVPTNEKLRLELQNLDKYQLIDKVRTYPASLISHVDFSSTKRLIRALEVAEYLQHHTLKKIEQPLLNPLVIGLVDELETRRAKIVERLHLRLNEGLIEEVEQLIESGVSKEMLTFYGLEYKFVTSYLMKEIDYATLVNQLSIAICQFAKRQMTFFRKMEKDGVNINWLSAEKELLTLSEEALQLINHQFELK